MKNLFTTDHFQALLFDDLQTTSPDAYAARIKRPGVVDAWTCSATAFPVHAFCPASASHNVPAASSRRDFGFR